MARALVSPLPCPFNYGAVPTLPDMEGDLLDALVLGPRLSCGTRLRVKGVCGYAGRVERPAGKPRLVDLRSPLTFQCKRVDKTLDGLRQKCRCLDGRQMPHPGHHQQLGPANA